MQDWRLIWLGITNSYWNLLLGPLYTKKRKYSDPFIRIRCHGDAKSNPAIGGTAGIGLQFFTPRSQANPWKIVFWCFISGSDMVLVLSKWMSKNGRSICCRWGRLLLLLGTGSLGVQKRLVTRPSLENMGTWIRITLMRYWIKTLGLWK